MQQTNRDSAKRVNMNSVFDKNKNLRISMGSID